MSRKPRGCRYKLVGIMDSGVDIVVLGVAIGVLGVAIGVLVYNRILGSFVSRGVFQRGAREIDARRVGCGGCHDDAVWLFKEKSERT